MHPTLPRFLNRLAPALLASVAVIGEASGQSDAPLYTGHAIPGFYGFESCATPPSGVSYQNMVYLYHAVLETDRGGNDTGVNGSVRHLSDHFTLNWGSPWKIFGGIYFARATVSMVNSAPNPRSLDAGNRGFKLGDTYLEPLSLYWPGEKGYTWFSTGFHLDTGDFEAGNNNSSGKGFNTTQVTLGWTYYPYEEQLWHSSLLVRWGQHSKVSGLDVRPGDDIVADWSIGKHLSDRWNVGVVGYGVWQTSRDKGADANRDLGFYGTAALGVGARYELPDWGGHAQVRLYQEFASYNHTQGQALAFELNFKL